MCSTADKSANQAPPLQPPPPPMTQTKRQRRIDNFATFTQLRKPETPATSKASSAASEEQTSTTLTGALSPPRIHKRTVVSFTQTDAAATIQNTTLLPYEAPTDVEIRVDAAETHSAVKTLAKSEDATDRASSKLNTEPKAISLFATLSKPKTAEQRQTIGEKKSGNRTATCETSPIDVQLVAFDAPDAVRTLMTTAGINEAMRMRLPATLEVLLRVFAAMDSIAQFNAGRNALCHFAKVRKAIENIVNRTVTLGHVASVQLLFPDAFEFGVGRALFAGRIVKGLTFSLRSSETTHEALSVRKERFYALLMAHAVALHNKFLKARGFEAIAAADLRRWHPAFDEAVTLPVDASEERILQCVEAGIGFEVCNAEAGSADDASTAASFDANSQPQTEVQASQTTAAESENSRKQKHDPISSIFSDGDIRTPTKHIEIHAASNDPQKSNEIIHKKDSLTIELEDKQKPQSLLERIKLKERQNVEATMRRPVASSEDASLMPLLETLFVAFASAKKTALSQGDAVAKLRTSHANVSSDDSLWKGVCLLAKRLPSWIAVVPCASTVVVKMLSRTPLANLRVQLRDACGTAA